MPAPTTPTMYITTLHSNNRTKSSLQLSYIFYRTPFGLSLIALYNNAICHLSFVDERKEIALENLKREWKGALLCEEPQEKFPFLSDIFQNDTSRISLVLVGTPFHISVWKALLDIPKGGLKTYEEIAQLSGKPKAIRAAASAIARNKIAYLIPCHRVIRKSGELGGYRWGIERKKALLKSEKIV